MTPRLCLLVGMTVCGLAGGGCGKAEPSEAAHHHAEHAEDAAPEAGEVAFQAERGLRLSPAVITALGLTTAAATVRELAAERTLIAQVVATTPRPLARVQSPLEQAPQLESLALRGATWVRTDRTLGAATGLVDLVVELDPTIPRAVGDFVTLTAASVPTSGLTVPRTALLDSVTGTFVYVVHDDAYRRTPVTVGLRATEFIQITNGLREGEVVVVTPVEQLWLAELRLTKGGGHSH